MADATQDRARFEALVAQFAAQSLDTKDRAWMEAYIQANPHAAQEVKWHVGMVQQLHAKFEDVPANIGLAKAMAQVQMLPKRQAAAQASTTPLQRLMQWFFAGTPRFSPAFAMLLVCALVPSLVLMQQPGVEHAQTRSIKRGLFDGPLLRVNFKGEVRESDIRYLLLEQGGLVVGPTRLGDWFVRVAPTRVEDVRAALGKSAYVASVEVVQTLPAELVDQ
jgi:hypothetical protein